MVFREQHAYLRSIELLRDRIPSFTAYPFNLPSLRELTSLPLHPKVTYIIGENGMGKSTLLEAAAIAWGFNPEGGSLHFTFSTRSSHSELHRYIRLVRGVRKPKDASFSAPKPITTWQRTLMKWIVSSPRPPLSYGHMAANHCTSNPMENRSSRLSFTVSEGMAFTFWMSPRRPCLLLSSCPCWPVFTL